MAVGEGVIVGVDEGIIVTVFVGVFGSGVLVGSVVASTTNVAADVLVGSGVAVAF